MADIEKMTMAALYLDAQIETLASFGFARDKSLKILGLSEQALSKKRARFPVEKLVPLYLTASTELADPNICLKTGFNFRVSTFQKTGNIYTVCDNIRQVVQMNRRYQRVAIYAGDVSMVEHDERCFLHFDPFFEDSYENRAIINIIFGAYGTAFRWLNWGSGKGLKSVYLTQAEPEDTHFYNKVFDCPIIFGAPYNRLEFFPEHLDLALPTKDPLKRAQFEYKLDYVIGKHDAANSLVKALHLSIQGALEQGSVNFTTIANSMNMPEKKLRKLLKSSGTNFRKEVEVVRISRFRDLIKQDRSFANIAQSLAYNDQAAFSRAFKRWYGVAPGEWTEETPLLLD